MEIIKKLIKDERGNAIIETSVALPMLLGLFMGLLFFTNGMRYKLVITMAAKEGAREYQVTMGNSQKAINKAYQELSIGHVQDVSVSVDGDGTVRVTKPYGFYVPLSGRYLLNIKAEHLFKEELAERYYKKGW